MRFPLGMTAKLSKYIAGKRLRRVEKFPLVMMLEPLHTCNLTCTGCGRIREYKETITQQLYPACGKKTFGYGTTASRRRLTSSPSKLLATPRPWHARTPARKRSRMRKPLQRREPRMSRRGTSRRFISMIPR